MSRAYHFKSRKKKDPKIEKKASCHHSVIVQILVFQVVHDCCIIIVYFWSEKVRLQSSTVNIKVNAPAVSIVSEKDEIPFMFCCL